MLNRTFYSALRENVIAVAAAAWVEEGRWLGGAGWRGWGKRSHELVK